MEDMEVLETEQETEAQTEEITEQITEETTQEQTEQETEQENQEPTQTQDSLVSEMPSLADNAIHQMFYELGVDLDYVPKTKGEMCTLSLQVVCVLFFIWLFFRTLFQAIRELGKGV